MSIDSAASLLQTVNTINAQLTRGLTVSLNNSHTHYHLRNMEYWSETDCFNAPTITIGPGKWGVGAFRSKVTCGTSGILCYELVLDPWKLKKRLFLLAGWSVPLLGDNSYFLHIAHVDSPDFPRERSERKRLCNLLMKSQIGAGNTISLHMCPEVVDHDAIDKDNNDNDKENKDKKDENKKDEDKEDKDKEDKDKDKNEIKFPTMISVSATMATSAIANLKIEINPYSEPMIMEDVKAPILMTIPGPKFSFTRYMEEKFHNAENAVNDTLVKYMGTKDESNPKKDSFT